MSRATLPASLALLVLAGCSADYSMDKGGDSGWNDEAPESDADADGDWDDTGDAGSEDEEGFPMLTPAATDVYVFVANPDRGTVTRISVPSLEVITVEVGEGPADVQTTSDYTKAVVFDEDSDDVAVIDADTLEVQRVEVRQSLNAMSMSPDGRWVVVYRDADLVDEEDGTGGGGVESFNEISLVDTDTYAHFPMVVGANPRQVKFTDDSEMALVVSDAEVALIDLTTAEPEPVMVEVAEDPLDPERAEEVVVSPDGSYAFVRQYGADDIVVLDLVEAAVERLPVGANPTDLDLTPDGAKAVVVCRGSKELWLLDTTDPAAEPDVLSLPEEETLGSVLMTPDGTKGLLYTTATLTDRYAVWDVATGAIEVRELVKPVAGMTVSPTGETLLVFHTEEDAEGADTTSPYYGEWALTMLDLDDFRQNALLLADEPTAFAHADDGKQGYFIMDGEPYLVVLDYGTLLADDEELKSLPTYVGTLPTTAWAYVSQEHPLGRITFYDGSDGSMQTITGFELNGETEH